MIIVIADDFTGAAEMAGIALEFGLSTEIQTEFVNNPDRDVIVIDTNTRSKPAIEAAQIVRNYLEELNGLSIDLLFKKTDSVLRGNVYAELSVIKKYYPGKSVLLIPANPSLGRTIREGMYYINGKLIEESIFSNDPESPARSSHVRKLLNQENEPDIQLLGVGDRLPFNTETIYIADAMSGDDIEIRARQQRQDIIPAGAADYFSMLLTGMGYIRERGDPYQYDLENKKSLLVCGSSLSDAENIRYEIKVMNPHVIEVYGDQLCADNNSHKLVEIIKDAIYSYKETNMVIVLVKIDENKFDLSTYKLPLCLATVVRKVLKKVHVDELFVEGGTTSSEIVRKGGWSRFQPLASAGNGIIRMSIYGSEIYLTVKPGSYEWPASLWQRASANHKPNQKILIQGN